MATSSGVQRLTERQKAILRLLFCGHDAKSAAQELGISVHTVNEHLREVRRHLHVSSSREAARILALHESRAPNVMGPKKLGVDRSIRSGSILVDAVANIRAVSAGGVVVIVLAVAAIVLTIGKTGSASETADAPPKVVSTSPAAGSVISPGPFTLTVTFDRPMLDGNYSFVRISPETYPDCDPHAELSGDGRTYTMRCTATPGRSYEVWFNRPPFMNFKSLKGVPAEPHQLRFSEKSG